MLRALESLTGLGLAPDLPSEDAKCVRTLNSIILVVLLNVSLLLALFVFLDARFVIYIGIAALPLFGLVLLLNAIGWHTLARNVAPIVSSSVITLTAITLGPDVDSPYFLLSVIVAVTFTYPARQRTTMIAMVVLVCLLFILIHTWFLVGEPIEPLDPGLTTMTNLFTGVGVLMIVVGFSLYIYVNYRRSEADLAREKERSDSLLLNILPEEIADQLKTQSGRIAERFEEVTVLFADIVNFSVLSERMPPEELVALLDEIFSGFDSLAEEFGIEKIKTIGDAYLAVAGLPETRADHCETMASMALALLKQMRGYAHQHDLNVRIGLHTGPVVAGVIGHKKFSYDLWGDTVNTASRMESHGVAGRIHVTQAVRAKLAARFQLEERGLIQVKGKGEMQTFFLNADG